MSAYPKKSLVIIPTYNEAENINLLIDELFKISKTLIDHSLEILVVDDNSPDGTGENVKILQKKYPSRINIISGKKAGLGRAYLRGFKYALSQVGYDSFIMMDADFSHDPKAIPALLAQIDKGGDYVIGSRYAPQGNISSSWPRSRRVQSRLANFLARLFTGLRNIEDLTSGLKAIKKDALSSIDLGLIKATGYAFQVNLAYVFWLGDFDIREVPINFDKRRHGSSKLRLRDIIEFIFLTYRLNPDSRIRRLIRFCFVGAIGTAVNLLVLVFGVSFLSLTPLVAVAIAIEISIIGNFFMNHYFTFRFARQKHLAKETWRSLISKIVRYNSVAIGGASITYLVFAICYKDLKVHYILADIVAIVIATGWNYFMSVRIVWKLVDK